MMSEWKKVSVSDLGRIVTGKTPKTAISEYYGGCIPFLTPSDDMSVKYVLSTSKTITEDGKNSVKNAVIPKNSICVSCIGSDLGKVVITTKETVTNQQINSVIVNTELYDVDFVYYAMVILGKVLNYHSKTSTAVPIVNKSTFSQYEILCPVLSEQRKIARILSEIDSKIAINTAINENLEQQAQALSDKWVAEHLDCITMRPLADVAEINPDTYSPKDKWAFVNYLDTSSITNGVMSEIQLIRPDTEKLPSRARRIIKANDIVYSTVRPNQLHFGIISNPLDNMLASTGFAVIRSKYDYISSPYIYHFLTSPDFIEKMQQLAEQSTSTFPSVKPSDIGTCLIPCANEAEMLDITNKINGMYALVSANHQENKRLAALRDTLLPKLMNGEIDVSAIKI